MGTIYKLIIEDDEGKTTVYPLSHGEVSIGRKDGNTIRLMERNVSRRHARLMRSNGSVFIEDLDSYNGIRINGERINGKYEVKEGDLVEIGDYHLALQAAEVEDDQHRAEPSRAEHATSGESMAGTVPDFRLPEEILAGVRAGMAQAKGSAAAVSARDTLVDQPVSALPPQPSVLSPKSSDKPMGQGLGASLAGGREPVTARGDERVLPPFPLAGGIPVPGGPAAAKKAPLESEVQTREMKPLPGARQGEIPGSANLVQQGPARVAPGARLICVSTSYAGREFALSRPELVIGRVEDNDIVIEHRSVSRNHAKIVFDGRVYKIIDLQSANGILVNGEEYAMTDLRKGDLIELGHVRFRFIPGNEAFVPTDDEVREMREAGVAGSGSDLAASPPPARATESPPPSPKEPPQLSPARVPPPRRDQGAEGHPPQFDPSTAATVTDTPLSALAVDGLVTPEVQTPTPIMTPPLGHEKRPEPAPRRPEPSTSDRGPKAEPAASRTPPSAHDQRPTEVGVSARPNGVAGTPSPAAKPSVSAPATAPSSEIRSPSIDLRAAQVKGTSKKLVGLAVAVALVLAAGAFVLTRGGANEYDQRIQAEFAAGHYEAVVELFEKHENDFGDAVEASKAYGRAVKKISESKPVKPEPEPNKEDPQPAGPSGALEKGGAPPDVAPTQEQKAAALGELPEGSEDAAASAAVPPKKAAAAPRTIRERKARANELLAEGKIALMHSDLEKAYNAFNGCIQSLALARCHLGLAQTYSAMNKPEEAIKNYQIALTSKRDLENAAIVEQLLAKEREKLK